MTEFALPLVVRMARAAPPERTDALEAAASAALLMLTSDRPHWRARIEAWDGSRIRKVVRRARGADWRRAGTVEGLDVVHRTAQVRVHPPVPVDDWPPELSRLQVGGTTLVDTVAPGPAPAGLPLVLLSPHADLTTGKAMAQAAHAAQLAWRTLSWPQREAWRREGFALAVRDATAEQWRDAVDAGVPVVHDGGFTEVEPGTATALAILPAAWTDGGAATV